MFTLSTSMAMAVNQPPERRQPGANKTISFESASVRPLARSVDNQQLYATNTGLTLCLAKKKKTGFVHSLSF
jgi:hypothetical protein